MRFSDDNFYPFAWLDEVVEITLNPDKTPVNNLQAGQMSLLQAKFKTEVHRALGKLKTRTFFLPSAKKMKAIIGHFVSALSLLQLQAAANLAAYPEDSLLQATGEMVILELEELSHQITRRYAPYLPAPAGTHKGETPTSSAVPFKVHCQLSVDQIGIILRASDDIKLLISNSISLIFRSIVPFLSTKNRSNISWKSMRSSTYHPEKRDKEIAIETLEKLIRKIRDY
jgi:hypothetical protein